MFKKSDREKGSVTVGPWCIGSFRVHLRFILHVLHVCVHCKRGLREEKGVGNSVARPS